MKRFGLLLALAWVILINAIVLGGAFWNRSEPPESSLLLTERELSVKSMDRENTGLFLKLNWFRPDPRDVGKIGPKDIWLNRSKLKELGFYTDVPVDQPRASRFYSRQLPRQVYIVLELNGPAWQQWVTRVKGDIQDRKLKIKKESDPDKIKAHTNAIQHFKNGLIASSRLIAIDAARDPKVLRQKYPDTSKYLITAGVVRISVHYYSTKGKNLKNQSRRFLRGYIQEILIDEINVPSKLRDFFTTYKKHRGFSNHYFPENISMDRLRPRYQVTLNYGRRYEPWIQKAEVIKQEH